MFSKHELLCLEIDRGMREIGHIASRTSRFLKEEVGLSEEEYLFCNQLLKACCEAEAQIKAWIQCGGQ